MLQSLRTSVVTVFVLLFAAAAVAQAPSRADFRAGFSKGVELGDDKMMDQWMKKQNCAAHAALYFEELYAESRGGRVDNSAKTDALMASWERSFEGRATLQKLKRWLDGMDNSTYGTLQKGRGQSLAVWNNHLGMSNPSREELLHGMANFITLADNARSIGHMIESAELWSLAATVADKINKREKTVEDRREIVRAREEFLRAREAWEFTMDGYYVASQEFVKAEKIRIADEEKKAAKREAEGYAGDVRGVDSLLVPGAPEEKAELVYMALTDWAKDLDYGPKNGPVPALWWNTSTNEPGTLSKMAWFQRRDIYFGRIGGNKFVVSLDPNDLSKGFSVAVSSRPKPSTFWLDGDKTVPYTMWFWAGSDRERVGMAECNLAVSSEFALVYYRSAASWHAKIGKDQLVFYDDNANGYPCDADPWKMSFKIHTSGEHEGDGAEAPLFDSMRFGTKGPRRPFSEFVKLSSGWHHLRRTQAAEIGVRPLNPEYFKTGKAKLVWKGPKKSAPAQLVVQGSGDYKTAFFDLAGGKEVELPVGEYRVIFGRVVVGKGARVQNATLYEGDSEPFMVEEGKTTTLDMGAPFRVAFTRRGDQNLSIDALKVFVQESSGCILTELQGMPLAPEVVWAKTETGKGAKAVAKFVPFTDGELVNVAGRSHTNLSTLTALFPLPQGYREGALTLSATLPAEGLKVALRQKKHPVFGPLAPHWQ